MPLDIVNNRRPKLCMMTGLGADMTFSRVRCDECTHFVQLRSDPAASGRCDAMNNITGSVAPDWGCADFEPIVLG